MTEINPNDCLRKDCLLDKLREHPYLERMSADMIRNLAEIKCFCCQAEQVLIRENYWQNYHFITSEEVRIN